MNMKAASCKTVRHPKKENWKAFRAGCLKVQRQIKNRFTFQTLATQP
jgi:hypothetical protein